MNMLSFILSVLLSLILALLAMAFYTLMERKFLGYFALRKGPNKVGIMGIPQPFADAIKLFIKEQSKPMYYNMIPFLTAPTLSLILALMMWSFYPHSHQSFFIMFSVLLFLCISSMNVYSTFIAGWSSNSKYALLGALRGVAQTISYEVSMSLILLSVLILLMSSMDFFKMNLLSSISFMIIPLFIIWFITNLAETNRTPFDFAEGESELVSGFNVEYSSGMFALIFMAEYANILVMSLFSSILFISSMFIISDMFLIMKTTFLAMLFVWVRATLPRMRYDHLMNLTWKMFLPLSICMMMMIIPISMYLL
uniref:NADH dehydrogenase subunit 1 n=1 Tax=Drawida ghilarovi TaxID=994964 RepID=UPI0021B4F2B8|nr:NADH dehydrogenase subunit 1 [Drawida ghilarovi]UIX22936.1 NADH dehydrogenase subunit 1 [Drawida ghilarovi]UIX22949.1 NADH dehydrogenase subunit 1 [Drawida ghilarovi]